MRFGCLLSLVPEVPFAYIIICLSDCNESNRAKTLGAILCTIEQLCQCYSIRRKVSLCMQLEHSTKAYRFITAAWVSILAVRHIYTDWRKSKAPWKWCNTLISSHISFVNKMLLVLFYEKVLSNNT